MTHHRALRIATPDDVEGDGRTVTVCLMAWDTPARVTDDGGRSWYTETFARGGLRPVDRPMLVRGFSSDDPAGHASPLVGRLVATEDRADGLYGTVRVADTAAGRDLLALRAEGVVEAISVEFDDAYSPRPGEHVRRTAAQLTGLSFSPYPQHPSSRILATRAHQQETTMTATDTPVEPVVPTEPVIDPTPPEPIEHERATTPDPPAHTRAAPRPGRPGTGHARYRSFGDFARAASLGEISDDQLASFHRALADLTTTDAAGLIQEQWIPEILDLVRSMTPTVNAFARRPLPESGLEISQPIVTTRPTVGKQAVEKTEITSTETAIGKVTWDVETYAGGNDVALQLIQRSSPSFLDELMRLYVQEMGRKINADAAAAVLAAADGVNAALEWVDVAGFDNLVIDAAGTMLTTLKRFPEVALLSVDAWKELGKATAGDGRPLYPGLSPTNPVGSFSVTQPSGNVRQLDYTVEPEFGAGIRAVIGVREAFRTMEGPIGTLTADVPRLIGRDVAVYQFVAMGVADARGLVLIENAV